MPSATVPIRTYFQLKDTMVIAQYLARYDRLAWLATEAARALIVASMPGQITGYVVLMGGNPATVAFGSESEYQPGRFLKYCEVSFGRTGARAVLCEKNAYGDAQETAMFFAIRRSVEDLGEEELLRGRHNCYPIVRGNSMLVYLIPGYLPGRYVFGGSRVYRFENGNRMGMSRLHLGYHYVPNQVMPTEIRLVEKHSPLPNECDIMKFMTMRGQIRKMRIDTMKYVCIFTHKESGASEFEILAPSEATRMA